jgi:hypothetical protein
VLELPAQKRSAETSAYQHLAGVARGQLWVLRGRVADYKVTLSDRSGGAGYRWAALGRITCRFSDVLKREA